MSALIATGMHEDPAPLQSRLPMIDVAKGVGILLIVLGHNRIFSSHYAGASDLLAAFRLPFFFFISGTVFSVKARSVGAIALIRADAWLKPYFVALLIGGGLKLLLGLETIESVLLGLIYGAGFTIPWNVLWFLPHLWLLYVSASAFLKYGTILIDSAPKKILTILTLLCVGFFIMDSFDTIAENPACRRISTFDMQLFQCGLPFSADILLLSGAYFLLGHFLSAQTKAFRINAVLMLLSIALSLMLSAKFGYRIDLNTRRYDHLVISTVQALAGVYMMLCVCTLMAQVEKLQQILAYLGRGSLMILLLHAQIQFPAVAFFGKYLPQSTAGAVGFLISVSIPLLFWEMCKKVDIFSKLFLPTKKSKIFSVSALQRV